MNVLDLCCGKGGDLFKWCNSVTHVICVDIAELSIEQCQSRYKNSPKIKYTAEFFTADCTRVNFKS